MPTVYILYSTHLDRFYIGSTVDLERRLNEHNAGRSRATKAGIPWTVAYSLELPTLKQARQIEHKLKQYKSRKILEQIVHDQEIMFMRR